VVLFHALTTHISSMSRVLFVITVTLIEHCRCGFFELSDDTSLNVYRKTFAVSHMQCALACNGDTKCDVFGFFTSSRHCFFSTYDVAISGEARQVAPDMKVYRKPGAKVIQYFDYFTPFHFKWYDLEGYNCIART